LLQVRIANSIILTLDVVTDLTAEEFYASANLPYLLAALLGLDPSQVKIVEVIRETNPERYWSLSSTTVSKPHLAGKPVNRVKLEFSNELGSDYEEIGKTRSNNAIDTKSLGNRLVAHQMEGTLEKIIQEASGTNMEIPSTTLTSSAVVGEVPSWYYPDTDAADQSILTQLNIDPDAVDQGDLDQLVIDAAEAMNMTSLLNHTTVEEQQELQARVDNCIL